MGLSAGPRAPHKKRGISWRLGASAPERLAAAELGYLRNDLHQAHLGWSGPHISCDSETLWSTASSPDYLRSAEMTEVMMNTPAMDEIGLSPRKDGLSYQIFPDPSDFDRYCKLKDRLPSIVVEPTEGDVESGELRWPPEEFLVQEEEEEEEEENCEDVKKDNKEQ
nr:PREDICTED: protein LBH [Opisthocomus hoazin]